MSKKKVYGMLAFTLFTFLILGIVISLEFNQYSKTDEQNKAVYAENSTIEDTEASASEVPLPVQTSEANTSEDKNSLKDSADTSITDNDDSDSAIQDTTTESTEDIEKSEDTVMVFSGDIYMSDYILNKYDRDGINGILSKELQKEFNNSDIAMANQEFPFTNRGKAMKDKQYTFRTDPKWVQILKDMQIDIVTLANNHTLDFGLEGLTDTFDTLNSSKIRYVGAGNNLSEAKETKYFKIKDKTIAVLGASRVIPVPEWNAGSNKPGLLTTYDPAALVTEIKAARELSDYVVVYVHWGIERKTKPEDYQRGLAKQYIDAGADLVVGSHPHVLQGIEYYNDVPIVYSLGNFMFYNSIEQTALLKATFSEDMGVKLQLVPCKASGAYTYIIDDKKAKSAFYDYITKISYDIKFDENGFILQ